MVWRPGERRLYLFGKDRDPVILPEEGVAHFSPTDEEVGRFEDWFKHQNWIQPPRAEEEAKTSEKPVPERPPFFGINRERMTLEEAKPKLKELAQKEAAELTTDEAREDFPEVVDDLLESLASNKTKDAPPTPKKKRGRPPKKKKTRKLIM
jgi:hypothetical protein